mmetsp:Transcript_43478/g.112615  ORF Transcript_43478/g.112615 Transcript_43478/m.112615 type:complete len:294 (-) Transcript_43478:673-1554(-)
MEPRHWAARHRQQRPRPRLSLCLSCLRFRLPLGLRTLQVQVQMGGLVGGHKRGCGQVPGAATLGRGGRRQRLQLHPRRQAGHLLHAKVLRRCLQIRHCQLQHAAVHMGGVAHQAGHHRHGRHHCHAVGDAQHAVPHAARRWRAAALRERDGQLQVVRADARRGDPHRPVHAGFLIQREILGERPHAGPAGCEHGGHLATRQRGRRLQHRGARVAAGELPRLQTPRLGPPSLPDPRWRVRVIRHRLRRQHQRGRVAHGHLHALQRHVVCVSQLQEAARHLPSIQKAGQPVQRSD